jgi:hypothetical protein
MSATAQTMQHHASFRLQSAIEITWLPSHPTSPPKTYLSLHNSPSYHPADLQAPDPVRYIYKRPAEGAKVQMHFPIVRTENWKLLDALILLTPCCLPGFRYHLSSCHCFEILHMTWAQGLINPHVLRQVNYAFSVNRLIIPDKRPFGRGVYAQTEDGAWGIVRFGGYYLLAGEADISEWLQNHPGGSLKRQRPWVYTGQDGATGEEVGRRLEEAILKYESGEEDRTFPDL